LRCHGPQQLEPALVESLEEGQRRANVSVAGILQCRPASFIVGLDGRHVLGQGPLETNVTVDMAVREVMDDLANGPFLVARIEVDLSQPRDGLAEKLGGRLDGRDEFSSAAAVLMWFGVIR